MSTRTFVSRHRSTATVVAGALAAVAVAGFGAAAGQDPADVAARQPLTANSRGPAPYGIGEAPPADDTSSPEAQSDPQGRGPNSGNDAVHPWEQGPQAESAPSDRRRQQTPGADRRGRSTAEVERGVRMRTAPGVVIIDTVVGSGEGMGTGMVLGEDGQVLTNYHVVEGSESVRVTVADTGETYSATLLGADPKRDVALLQLQDAKALPTVTVSEASAALGDTVYAVGNGNGQGFLTRLDGKVTGLNESIGVSEGALFGPTVQLSDLIETDADVVPGYSGGPLLDAKGEVIGLTTAASSGPRIDGYATPIGEVMAVVEKVRAGDESGTVRVGPKGALGVQVATDPQTPGGVVVALPTGSAAAEAGIARGDVITAIDGTPVESAGQLATEVGSREPGTQVSVSWRTTGGERRTGTVTLASSPVN